MDPKPKRLLVSDRNPNVVRLLRREFLGRGYEVVPATTAEQVLAALARRPPVSLVLLDMQLPGADAPGFWERITSSPGSPFVVVHAFSEDALPAELSGRAARVPKDGDIESLARAVSWCLARERPAWPEEEPPGKRGSILRALARRRG
jgi:CheY-like chemotaxis protein